MEKANGNIKFAGKEFVRCEYFNYVSIRVVTCLSTLPPPQQQLECQMDMCALAEQMAYRFEALAVSSHEHANYLTSEREFVWCSVGLQ